MGSNKQALEIRDSHEKKSRKPCQSRLRAEEIVAEKEERLQRKSKRTHFLQNGNLSPSETLIVPGIKTFSPI